MLAAFYFKEGVPIRGGKQKKGECLTFSIGKKKDSSSFELRRGGKKKGVTFLSFVIGKRVNDCSHHREEGEEKRSFALKERGRRAAMPRLTPAPGRVIIGRKKKKKRSAPAVSDPSRWR